MFNENEAITPNLAEIRKNYLDILSQVYSDPIELEYQVDWKVFCKAQPEQITRDTATKILCSREAYYREETNKSLAEDPSGNLGSWRFNAWSRVDDALKGAVESGPISKTSDYFRNEAASWQSMADNNKKILEDGGPFGDNPLKDIALKTNHIKVWERLADKLNVTARLFEKPKIQFVVSEDV